MLGLRRFLQQGSKSIGFSFLGEGGGRQGGGWDACRGWAPAGAAVVVKAGMLATRTREVEAEMKEGADVESFGEMALMVALADGFDVRGTT